MSSCRVTDLRHKEIINSADGCRLGYIDDVEIDTVTANMVSVIIYGKPKFFGLLGRYEDLVIRWENIELKGHDTVLISGVPLPQGRRKAKGFIPFLTSL